MRLFAALVAVVVSSLRDEFLSLRGHDHNPLCYQIADSRVWMEKVNLRNLHALRPHTHNKPGQRGQGRVFLFFCGVFGYADLKSPIPLGLHLRLPVAAFFEPLLLRYFSRPFLFLLRVVSGRKGLFVFNLLSGNDRVLDNSVNPGSTGKQKSCLLPPKLSN